MTSYVTEVQTTLIGKESKTNAGGMVSEQIKQELSKKYNPSNSTEGLKILSQSLKAKPGEQPLIEKIISDASKEFEQKTGRPMTYSEMRQMFG